MKRSNLTQWLIGAFFIGSYVLCQLILDENGEFDWETGIPFLIIYWIGIVVIIIVENRKNNND